MNCYRRIPPLLLAVKLVCGPAGVYGQESGGKLIPRTDEAARSMASKAKPNDQQQNATPSDYVLGPGDRLEIYSQDIGDLSGKAIAVGMGGYIDLPLCGRVKAAGQTVEGLQADIVSHLRDYVREPSVVVTVSEFHSQPVSVLGAVGTPGVHQLEGRRSLLEMLSVAGGVRNDAGNDIEITRSLEWGRIPLPDAKDDTTGRFSVADVKLDALMGGKRPDENVLIRPHDVISIPRAHLVYVIGEVSKAGGFVLEERESMSVLQALALAGGVASDASPKSAKILRGGADPAKRTEIPVNLKKIIAGQQEDMAMKPDDILFVPSNIPKKAGIKAAEAAVSTLTGVVIWRGGHL